MTPTVLATLIPVLFGVAAAQPSAVSDTVSRMVVQDEVIMRVPIQPRPMVRERKWMARKGPKCIRVANIRRALLSPAGEVDFVLANRARVRAKLDRSCPALDFYGGLYLQPEGPLLCATRDTIHSRMGGSCTIGEFRHLVPIVKR